MKGLAYPPRISGRGGQLCAIFAAQESEKAGNPVLSLGVIAEMFDCGNGQVLNFYLKSGSCPCLSGEIDGNFHFPPLILTVNPASSYRRMSC